MKNCLARTDVITVLVDDNKKLDFVENAELENYGEEIIDTIDTKNFFATISYSYDYLNNRSFIKYRGTCITKTPYKICDFVYDFLFFEYWYISKESNFVYKFTFSKDEQVVSKTQQVQLNGLLLGDINKSYTYNTLVGNKRDIQYTDLTKENLQKIQKDIETLEWILGKEITNYFDFIRSTTENSCNGIIDLSYLTLSNCQEFSWFIALDDCYRIIFPSLDLYKLTSLTTPFGLECMSNILDMRSCYNDIDEHKSFRLKLFLPDNDKMQLVVIRKEAINLKNKILEVYTQVEDLGVTIDVDKLYTKLVLLKNKRLYIVGV